MMMHQWNIFKEYVIPAPIKLKSNPAKNGSCFLIIYESLKNAIAGINANGIATALTPSNQCLPKHEAITMD